MSVGFVLGNGISRRGIPGGQLRYHGRVYGCNALYREFTPDVLVATDTFIANHIQHGGYSLSNKFYTRRPLPGYGAHVVPKFTYSSGPNAVAIAAMDMCDPIYLLGFDMCATDDNKFNNIYAGTEFYKSVDSEPTYSGNWVKQLIDIFGQYPNNTFYRVIADSVSNDEFNHLTNVKTINLNKFLSLLTHGNNRGQQFMAINNDK